MPQPLKINKYREELLLALARLAHPPDQQINYLRELGVYPSADELGLEFHELALLAPNQLQAGELSAKQRDAILALDSTLQTMSGPANAKLWTVDALTSSPEWDEVRRLAKESLNTLSVG
jgi:hypothetical protein